MSTTLKLSIGAGTALILSIVTVVSMLGTGASEAAMAPADVAAPVTAQILCPSGHGIYVGAGAPAAVIAFERWSGRAVGCVEDFLPSTSWGDISTPTWWLDSWVATSEKHPLVLSVPLLPDTGANLLAGAEGEYDQYFRTLATLMVAKGFGNTTVRLGWEFNGGEFPWKVLPAGGPDGKATSTNFVAYWRRVVLAMRSVPGSHFAFDWTVNNGINIVDAAQSYPGDGFVDVVGIDAYDQVWGPYGATVTDLAARWRTISAGTDDLDYWAAFARSHDKAVSLPEWGLVSGDHGGGDDPYYVQKMLAWAAANKVVYENYFDSDQSSFSTGQFPTAAAAYIAGIARP